MFNPYGFNYPNYFQQQPQMASPEPQITGVKFVNNIQEANNCNIPLETQAYRNGNALPGAHAIDTATTIGNLTSQAFTAIVTVPKNAPVATINFKVADATSVRIANVIVTKVA